MLSKPFTTLGETGRQGDQSSLVIERSKDMMEWGKKGLAEEGIQTLALGDK